MTTSTMLAENEIVLMLLSVLDLTGSFARVKQRMISQLAAYGPVSVRLLHSPDRRAYYLRLGFTDEDIALRAFSSGDYAIAAKLIPNVAHQSYVPTTSRLPEDLVEVVPERTNHDE